MPHVSLREALARQAADHQGTPGGIRNPDGIHGHECLELRSMVCGSIYNYLRIFLFVFHA